MMNIPDIELLPLTSDTPYHLHEDRGKVIVLTFWVSWCPDCARDLPKKEQLYKTMDHSKVKMVTVNVPGRERNESEAIDFASQFLTQPTFKDQGRKLYDAFECDGVPTTVIINQHGEVYKRFGDKAPFLDIVKTIGELI